MKVLIPAAGRGARLRPHTNTKPKPMVEVAGKPILGHILEGLKGIDISEIIIVTGFMGDVVQHYIRANFTGGVGIKFVDQTPRLGLGHAIYVANDLLSDDEPLLILLGDMIFLEDFKVLLARAIKKDGDAVIATKEVEHPERYGIVITDEKGVVKQLVEKPVHAPSNNAITGIYYIRNMRLFRSALKWIMTQPPSRTGEFQLTDVLERMVSEKAILRTFPVEEWFDCGQKDTILEANKVLLGGRTMTESKTESVLLIPPVVIGPRCQLENAILGPNVSISHDSIIKRAILSNTIIGSNSKIIDINLNNTMIGDDVEVEGNAHELSLGDGSLLRFRENSDKK